MYQTARSQRIYWTESRKKLQKERRAANLVQKVKTGVNEKGYKKILLFHNLFLKRAGLIN